MAAAKVGSLTSRSFTSISSHKLRLCVVGSGPAAFYTVDKILKAHPNVEVDIIDRLPVPFGLVRSGVAPDHPETKVVVNQFSRIAQQSRCSFFGNVSLGSSICLSELRTMYDVVVLAYGAESDRTLGIPREDLKGIYAAREFVWWYNGHPDCTNIPIDLKNTDTVVIIGQGNVALDAARILLKPADGLATTDIANHALAALEGSAVRKVYLVGRRGPVQAACTAKELRELLVTAKHLVNIQEADLVTTVTDEEVLKTNRIKRRVYDLLYKAAKAQPSCFRSGQRELHFVFFRKPECFLPSDDRSGYVGGVRFEKTIVEKNGDTLKQIAVGAQVFEDIQCGIVLKSIGYKSLPVDGLPFDHDRGVVPNVRGRVLTNTGGSVADFEKGLYVCGWLKRGPTGIIATNLYCAEETVASISEDMEAQEWTERKPGREGLKELLDARNARVVSFRGWEKIDAEEKRLGRTKNKPLEKLTTWEELLKVAAE